MKFKDVLCQNYKKPGILFCVSEDSKLTEGRRTPITLGRTPVTDDMYVLESAKGRYKKEIEEKHAKWLSTVQNQPAGNNQQKPAGGSPKVKKTHIINIKLPPGNVNF